jgi:hypothetical protein
MLIGPARLADDPARLGNDIKPMISAPEDGLPVTSGDNLSLLRGRPSYLFYFASTYTP